MIFNSNANPYKNAVNFNLNECDLPPLPSPATRCKPICSPVKYMGPVRKPIRRVFNPFVQDYKPFRSTVLPVCSAPTSMSPSSLYQPVVTSVPSVSLIRIVFLSISQLQYRNSNSYFNLLLLLSGDINLNPGLLQNYQLQLQSEWTVFNSSGFPFNSRGLHFNLRGLHFIHLNVNGLLSKIDELRSTAKLSNAAVVCISKSKLDDSVLSSEMHIDNCDTLRCDWNRHG